MSDQERFEELADRWVLETRHMSFTVVGHPAYQEILQMENALSFIRQRLERSMESDHGPEHWFHALATLTGSNPVPREHRGKMRVMAQHWIDWFKISGLDWRVR